MTLRAVLCLTFFFLTGSTAHAGSDAQLWLDAGVSYRPSKKVKLGLIQNMRMNENLSRLDSLRPTWKPNGNSKNGYVLAQAIDSAWRPTKKMS
jgi:hypothetical protein